MKDHELRFSDTNSADDSEGKTWKLDGNLFWFIVAGVFLFVVDARNGRAPEVAGWHPIDLETAQVPSREKAARSFSEFVELWRILLLISLRGARPRFADPIRTWRICQPPPVPSRQEE